MPDGPSRLAGTADEAVEREPAGEGDLIEGGLEPPRWHRRWRALPVAVRLVAVGAVVLLAAGAAGSWVRDRAAERAVAQRVDVTASLGVWSSSTAPLGGQVSYFVVVRNDGARPVWVTAVEASADGLRLSGRDGTDLRVGADDEAAVPLSVRLTCSRYVGGAGGDDALQAGITVRRVDGESVVRQVRLRSDDLLLRVATSLCTVKPDVADREISGPILSAQRPTITVR